MSLDATLEEMPLFSSVAKSDLEAVIRGTRSRRVSRGQYIFFEGEEPNSLGIILDGRVKLVKHSDDGKDLTLEVLSPGEAFGIVSLCEQEPYPASAMAMDDPTTVLLLSRDDLCRMVRRFPDVALALVSALGLRLQRAYENMQALAGQRVERRIANNLLKLAEKFGLAQEQGILIDLPLTRQDIADLSGTTVETTIRTISRLRERNIVRSEGDRILITDAHQLVRIAEDW